ncbi:MAG: addiction module antidote protein, HigA family [Bacteroidetes bacterium]|nr:MAG: addiction module antidote protein, HigA family [Bacteroidota bacterium]MBL1145095.1 addiction module antidote protein, HigA family [Bacteroidota bacterium]MCB0802132.1 HigA family addiction module antidote protein [Flavobacteriales bacterium]NOG57892.1 HigA family addiction module antidote protein [Bacteroidota bacterium]
MLPNLTKIKGVHPGAILRREIKKQGLKSSQLAERIDEHKQTISAILNKRRAINPKLSIKLAKQFNVDEDYFMMLQASFDVKKAAELEIKKTPNINNFRKAIFWDTTIDKIDWNKNKRAVIKRILERGNENEINEIISFYGKTTIAKEVKMIRNSILPSLEKNILDYNL